MPGIFFMLDKIEIRCYKIKKVTTPEINTSMLDNVSKRRNSKNTFRFKKTGVFL